jgi:tRNA A-37 threonylcarbamoyl transferase component Bud32
VRDLAPGSRLGGFLLTRVLGTGGQATVWVAHDEALGRDVAVKVFRGDASTDGENVERLRREARSLAALKHENVLPVLQWGEHDGHPFIVLPFIEGGTLEQAMATRGRMPWAEARPILRDVAAAMEAAHALCIVHRDIKPSNVLLERDSGRALLSDFGIALTDQETSGPLTATGAVMGTPQYLSPERRFAGLRGSASSDVYAFGLLAKDLLDASTAPKAPADLLAQCLRPDPDARPDARTLREAFADDAGGLATSWSDLLTAWDRAPRYVQVLLVAMAAAMVIVVVLLLPRNVRDSLVEAMSRSKVLKFLRLIV